MPRTAGRKDINPAKPSHSISFSFHKNALENVRFEFIPVPVRIYRKEAHNAREKTWIPAFAGMTESNIRQIQIRTGITVISIVCKSITRTFLNASLREGHKTLRLQVNYKQKGKTIFLSRLFLYTKCINIRELLSVSRTKEPE